MTGKPKWTSPILGPVTAESIRERRTTLSNDNEVVDGTAPPASQLDVDYHGKFFSRGCRGIIESLDIYCIRTGSGTLTLSYAPHPGLGPVGSVTITPGSSWAWKSTAVEKMWNYDSLFIWVSVCSSDVSWAYDTDLSPDGHSSDDSGATWEDTDERIYIHAVMTGETPGDVAVSGVINTVPLPYVSSRRVKGATAVPVNVETTLITINGAGYCDLIMFQIQGPTYRDLTFLKIYCDGSLVFNWTFSLLNGRLFGPASYPIAIVDYGFNSLYMMTVSKRWDFRRKLEIKAKNDYASVTAEAWAYPNLLR